MPIKIPSSGFGRELRARNLKPGMEVLLCKHGAVYALQGTVMSVLRVVCSFQYTSLKPRWVLVLRRREDGSLEDLDTRTQVHVYRVDGGGD